MVTTLKQAERIQGKRVKNKLKGYAKAVRRYLNRSDVGDYKEVKSGLPVYWDSTETI